jgi:predicted RNase H-like nuclease (RuvC/YqgF family)
MVVEDTPGGGAAMGEQAEGRREDRLRAVEEEVGFAGRKAERLERTVEELSSLLHELTERLGRLERRLADAASPEASVEEPDPEDGA